MVSPLVSERTQLPRSARVDDMRHSAAVSAMRTTRSADDRSNGFGVRSAPSHPVEGLSTASNVDQFSVAIDSTDA